MIATRTPIERLSPTRIDKRRISGFNCRGVSTMKPVFVDFRPDLAQRSANRGSVPSDTAEAIRTRLQDARTRKMRFAVNDPRDASSDRVHDPLATGATIDMDSHLDRDAEAYFVAKPAR